MRRMWIACHDGDGYDALLQEIQRRDRDAKVLSVPGVEMLAHVTRAGCWDDESLAAGVYVRDSADALTAVAILAGVPRMCRIICMVDELDPGDIASLFASGASEVVAAGELQAHTNTVPEERVKGDYTDRSPSCDGLESGAWGSLAEDEALDSGYREAQPPEAKLREPGQRESGCQGAKRPEEDDELGASSDPDARPFEPDLVERACGDARGAYELDEPESIEMHAASEESLAPLIVAVHERGGVGATTLIAASACHIARQGLRCAVLDLDLMFGDLYRMLGVENLRDFSALARRGYADDLTEEDIVSASMRVTSGLTIWGPAAIPERAELMGPVVDQMIEVLRRESDIILADTSSFWGDAVASAVCACDRLLVVGNEACVAGSAGRDVLGLATRLGVPRTKMASVFTRYLPRGANEDDATRFEFQTALHSKVRIADGGSAVGEFAELGRMGELMAQQGTFQDSIRAFTDQMLLELGCGSEQGEALVQDVPVQKRRHMRLPWRRAASDAA